MIKLQTLFLKDTKEVKLYNVAITSIGTFIFDVNEEDASALMLKNDCHSLYNADEFFYPVSSGGRWNIEVQQEIDNIVSWYEWNGK
jgi:hypothetical protein